MQFRFLEGYGDNKYEDYQYLTAITIKKDYDTFLKVMKESVGLDIMINGKLYTIDEIVLAYDGDPDKYFAARIYCVGY